jgi:DNA-3-methyladenine glycosylase
MFNRTFFERQPDQVASELIGSLMIVRTSDGRVIVRLVETEAYGGDDDQASHAFRGVSKRNASMFGPAGHLYVYRSYGMHWCVNVVTGESGVASAVLLRAAEVVRVGKTSLDAFEPGSMRGPGNLTRALGITGDDDGSDCCSRDARITFHASTREPAEVVMCSERIGISKARERRSRYYLEGNPAVSKAPRTSSTS